MVRGTGSGSGVREHLDSTKKGRLCFCRDFHGRGSFVDGDDAPEPADKLDQLNDDEVG